MGLSSDEFWNLSWWDWHLQLIRYQKQIEAKNLEYESRWSHTREIIATIINVNRDPKKSAIRGRDLIQLSFDKDEIVTEEDLKKVEDDNANFFKRMKSRLGSKIKKDASK